MTLKELEIGKSAVITAVGGEGALRQHFLDMGVIPGAEITLIKFAPMGDPMELRIHGYELTLRLDDAARIDVELLDALPAAEDAVVEEDKRLNDTLRYEKDGNYTFADDSSGWSICPERL